MFRPTGRAAASLGGVWARQRPSSAFSAAQRTRPSAGAAAVAAPRRGLHHVPISRHDPEAGVPGLLSAEGFDLAWTQQMTLMLTRVNQLIAGTEYEDRELRNILLDTARMPAQAALFNHASMAHNTDFFFKMIMNTAKQTQLRQLQQSSGTTAAEDLIPSSLRVAIEDSFGSVDTLRREFAATAAAMFGPGFVWLVKTSRGSSGSGGGIGGSGGIGGMGLGLGGGNFAGAGHPFPHGLTPTGGANAGRGGNDTLRLLVTYLAGSPYPGAHFRRQAVDMNTVGAEPATPANSSSSSNTSSTAAAAAAAAAATDPARQWLDNQAAALGGGFGTASTTGAVDRRPPGGVEVMPLLCLSTWEHVWLRDYGLGADGQGGKAAFVDAWWRVVDWEEVSELANLSRPKMMT